MRPAWDILKKAVAEKLEYKVKVSSDAQYQSQLFGNLKTDSMRYSPSGEQYINPLFDFVPIITNGAFSNFFDQYIESHQLPHEPGPELDTAAEELAEQFLNTQIEVNTVSLMMSMATVKLVSKNRLYVIWARIHKKSFFSNSDNLIQLGGIDHDNDRIVFKIQFISEDGKYLLSEAGEHIKIRVHSVMGDVPTTPWTDFEDAPALIKKIILNK